MSESFVLSENLNKVLGYGEESLVFLRMFYAVKQILPEAIIRGTNEDLIGVSLPEKRFIFYVLKKGEITSVKFKSSKAIDFTVDNTSLLIQLAVDEAHRVIEQPEAYLIHQPKQQKIEGQISTIVETVSTIDHNSQGQASDVIIPYYEQFNVDPNDYSNLSIEWLPISTRARNILIRGQILTFADLLRFDDTWLMAISQLGHEAFIEIKTIIPSVLNGTADIEWPKNKVKTEGKQKSAKEDGSSICDEIKKILISITSEDIIKSIQLEDKETFIHYIEKWCKDALSSLATNREHDIVTRILFKKETYASIGLDYEITRERVRQIYRKVGKKIQRQIRYSKDPEILLRLKDLLLTLSSIERENLCALLCYSILTNREFTRFMLSLFVTNEIDCRSLVSVLDALVIEHPNKLQDSNNGQQPCEDGHPTFIDKRCPKCGSALVIRTATKGIRAGKQFYGCSAFPRCWYAENIDE